MLNNLLLNTDSYKVSHYLQYPPHTTHINSYIESRGGKFTHALFFGLQMFLKQYLQKPITQADIQHAKEITTLHGEPFNEPGWSYILKQHKGYLPLEIQAVAEGTLVPNRNVLLQVVNTDPKCAWLTNYIETALLRAIWYPTTVATLSWYGRQLIQEYLEKTADSLDSLEFKLHDFGARGASSHETAQLGAAAHLVNFKGTDTLGGLLAAREFYGAQMAGFSIPAAEHSTITCWGRENEKQAYEHMLAQFLSPNKMVAVVSDSYDLWNAIDNIWGRELKSKIENSQGTLVIRPDSGDPVTIVCQTLEKLMNRFGCSVNQKGYRVLPSCIRVLQGDGVSLSSIQAVLAHLSAQKISAENVAFGMGGELLQKVNRDTLQFAMKSSAAQVNGQWQDVFKSPVTDPLKHSKRGRLALIKKAQGTFETCRIESMGQWSNCLNTVYKNGQLLEDQDFESIRQRAREAQLVMKEETQNVCTV